jgi:glutaredoxin 2
METSALTIILAVIGGGLFGFLSSIYAARLNAPKIRAEQRKLIAEANGVDQATIEKYQERNEEIYELLTKERKAREDEKIGERLSRDAEIRQIKTQAEKQYSEFEQKINDLQTSKEMIAGAFESQLAEVKTVNARITRENFELKKLVQRHGGEIDKLNKVVTGPLPPMPR